MRLVYKGRIIKTARATGGKAGKGNNKTSTVQVLTALGENKSFSQVLLKQIRFTMGDRASLEGAIQRAKDWIDGKPPVRGGKRPGSGAKKELEGGEATPAYLDDRTRARLRDLGEGNLSAGIRKAGEIVEKLSPEAIEDLLRKEEE